MPPEIQRLLDVLDESLKQLLIHGSRSMDPSLAQKTSRAFRGLKKALLALPVDLPQTDHGSSRTLLRTWVTEDATLPADRPPPEAEKAPDA
jgi:hypothetical protein